MIEYASFSNKGDKARNEDAVKVFVNQPLHSYGFVLADGLGGHGNGDVASNFAVDCVGAVIENARSMDRGFLEDSFETAQRMLMEEKERTGYSSIKTTMVTLIINGTTAQWGHVGDSRLYYFSCGKLQSRTLDHSVPQLLALRGQIKEKEIRHHPDRSMLLRAMGAEWDAPAYEIDNRDVRLRIGDSFLLCSDGFWEWIEEKTMLRILKKGKNAYDALQEMADEVYANGMGKDMDNYSAILVNVI